MKFVLFTILLIYSSLSSAGGPVSQITCSVLDLGIAKGKHSWQILDTVTFASNSAQFFKFKDLDWGLVSISVMCSENSEHMLNCYIITKAGGTEYRREAQGMYRLILPAITSTYAAVNYPVDCHSSNLKSLTNDNTDKLAE